MKQVLSFVTFILISGVFALPAALDGDVSHQDQAHVRLVAREDWGSPIEAGVQYGFPLTYPVYDGSLSPIQV